MKLKLLSSIIISLLLLSCNETAPTPTFENKGEELVYKMVQKVGNYELLKSKKDVVYTYTYQTPDGKTDKSTEKYLFDGELSYGSYLQHERTFPELVGQIEQGYDGSEFWLKHNTKLRFDYERLERVAFSRPTNYYWFTMFQKLLDPGLIYEYLGEKEFNSPDGGSKKVNYDVVKITFHPFDGKPTDIYQLYINQNTSLVDKFLFTVADFNVMETPFLMELQYEKIDGILIPTKRRYKKSTWEADVSNEPWIHVNWSDIKFNNNLSPADFKK